MRIAVVGGTGAVGRLVVAEGIRRGHDAIPWGRTSGVDVTTGAGLAAAFAECDAVVDVTNVVTLSVRRARAFFETATRHLLAAERAAGITHHVALSVVGIDGVDAGYYAGKLAQERAVAGGGVPFTLARTAQFHEFVGQMLAGVPGPVACLPRTLMQPVAAREVAAHLLDCVEAGPIGRAPDLVGPQPERLADLARRQLRHEGRRRPVLEVPLPGTYGRALASGTLRGSREARRGVQTFETWLHD